MIANAAMLAEALRSGDAVVVDVREPGEYRYERISGSLNLPASRVVDEAAGLPKDKALFLVCQTGIRSAKAAEALARAGVERVYNLEGGLEAWKRKGLAVERSGGVIPIMRQVQIVAGSLALVGALVPGMRWLAALVGAGLVFAGASGTCLMAELLARMPWNRDARPGCGS